MDIRTELVALAIRALSGKTSLIRKPEPFEELLNGFFGLESYDKRTAREIVAETDRLRAARQRRKAQKKLTREDTGTIHVSSDRVD